MIAGGLLMLLKSKFYSNAHSQKIIKSKGLNCSLWMPDSRGRQCLTFSKTTRPQVWDWEISPQPKMMILGNYLVTLIHCINLLTKWNDSLVHIIRAVQQCSQILLESANLALDHNDYIPKNNTWQWLKHHNRDTYCKIYSDTPMQRTFKLERDRTGIALIIVHIQLLWKRDTWYT